MQRRGWLALNKVQPRPGTSAANPIEAACADRRIERLTSQ